MSSSSSTYLQSLFGLDGKTALMTGGTRGIGANIALSLAKAGADVILIQRSEENTATRDAIIALGRSSRIVVADLASKESIKAVVPKVTGEWGLKVDIFINCGGIQRRHPAELFPDEDWEEVLQVNLSTCFSLARDIGKHMLDTRKEGEARGKIINIASLVSFQGGLTVPAYAAAKHGILGLTKAFSNDWSGKGINVNAIAPGYISTEMNTALIADPTRSRQILERIPSKRWGTPDDFSGAVLFLAGAGSDYVCGECLTVDGGWMAR